MKATTVAVRLLNRASPQQIEQLARLLVDCVEGGASVSFMSPLALDKARAFWRGVAQAADDGSRALLVAESGGEIVGTVQVILDMPDNQPHRADIAKMLVLRSARKRGIGEALMREAERVAAARGRHLLVLDTASDDARRLYERCGWTFAGTIPGYALLPDGPPCDTHYYYRRLGPAAP